MLGPALWTLCGEREQGTGGKTQIPRRCLDDDQGRGKRAAKVQGKDAKGRCRGGLDAEVGSRSREHSPLPIATQAPRDNDKETLWLT
jgi:hypothetical protein